MRIKVNGDWTEQDQTVSVSELLVRLGLKTDRVAVERNREIVRRKDYGQTQLADGDEVEIVTLVGGG